MKRFIKPALIALVILFIVAGIHTVVSRENKLQFNQVELKSTTSELKQLQLDYDDNIKKQDDLLHQKNVNEAELEKVRQENEQLKQQKIELEKQVSAKQEAARVAASKLNSAATASTPAYAASGSKMQWLMASGIDRGDWENVDWIVSRESGWQPCAYNPGKNDCNANPSSACGLVQQYPCGKIPGDWRDPVAALKWQAQYVCGARFNGYAGNTCYARAVSYWKIHGNY